MVREGSLVAVHEGHGIGPGRAGAPGGTGHNLLQGRQESIPHKRCGAAQPLAVDPESRVDIEAGAAARAGLAAGRESRMAVGHEHHAFERIAHQRLERGAKPGEIGG